MNCGIVGGWHPKYAYLILYVISYLLSKRNTKEKNIENTVNSLKHELAKCALTRLTGLETIESHSVVKKKTSASYELKFSCDARKIQFGIFSYKI